MPHTRSAMEHFCAKKLHKVVTELENFPKNCTKVYQNCTFSLQYLNSRNSYWRYKNVQFWYIFRAVFWKVSKFCKQLFAVLQMFHCRSGSGAATINSTFFLEQYWCHFMTFVTKWVNIYCQYVAFMQNSVKAWINRKMTLCSKKRRPVLPKSGGKRMPPEQTLRKNRPKVSNFAYLYIIPIVL